MLSIEQIREASPRFTVVNVPEWGGDVRVRRLTVQEYIGLHDKAKSLDTTADKVTFFSELIRTALVNEDGSPLIAEADAYLIAENAPLLTRLGPQVLEVTGLGNAKKNSETQPGDSPTDSA